MTVTSIKKLTQTYGQLDLNKGAREMKIGQLYDLDRFKAFADSQQKLPGFKDSATGVILS